MSRREIITPDLRAALREAIEQTPYDHDERELDFARFVDELASCLKRMDKLGMDWRGRA
jgi:hypothetical protein